MRKGHAAKHISDLAPAIPGALISMIFNGIYAVRDAAGALSYVSESTLPTGESLTACFPVGRMSAYRAMSLAIAEKRSQLVRLAEASANSKLIGFEGANASKRQTRQLS